MNENRDDALTDEIEAALMASAPSDDEKEQWVREALDRAESLPAPGKPVRGRRLLLGLAAAAVILIVAGLMIAPWDEAPREAPSPEAGGPSMTRREEYELEYGTDALEIHEDAIEPGMRVLMIDDLLATGGTMAACCNMIEQFDCSIVGVAFLIELCFLKGRDKLGNFPIHSVIKVD